MVNERNAGQWYFQAARSIFLFIFFLSSSPFRLFSWLDIFASEEARPVNICILLLWVIEEFLTSLAAAALTLC